MPKPDTTKQHEAKINGVIMPYSLCASAEAVDGGPIRGHVYLGIGTIHTVGGHLQHSDKQYKFWRKA